jgi:hypothetical protein
MRPSLEKPFTKRAGGIAQGEGPEFKPQYHTKKKKKNRKEPAALALLVPMSESGPLNID